MKHKDKLLQTNEPKIDMESINVQTISTSNNWLDNEPIKMYVITFKLGNKKISQTRHMTESQMNEYKKNPKIDVVSNAGKDKGLQDTHINLKVGK